MSGTATRPSRRRCRNPVPPSSFAEADGDLVGFTHGVVTAEEGDVLPDVCPPGPPGRGIGTALYERLQEDLRDFNMKRMRAIDLASNESGREFRDPRVRTDRRDEVEIGGEQRRGSGLHARVVARDGDEADGTDRSKTLQMHRTDAKLRRWCGPPYSTMGTKTPSEADILRPIGTTSKAYFAMVAVAGLALLAFLIGWAYQLQRGWPSPRSVTGERRRRHVGNLHRRLHLVGGHRPRRDHPLGRGPSAGDGSLHAGRATRRVADSRRGCPRRGFTSSSTSVGQTGWSVVVGHYHITIHNSPLVWDVTVIGLLRIDGDLSLAHPALRRQPTARPASRPPRSRSIGSSRSVTPRRKIGSSSVWSGGLRSRSSSWPALAPRRRHSWLFAVIPTMPTWFGRAEPRFLTIARRPSAA